MRRRLSLMVLALGLALLLMGADRPIRAAVVVQLKAQQTAVVICRGDELIVTPYGENQAEIVCREWVQ